MNDNKIKELQERIALLENQVSVFTEQEKDYKKIIETTSDGFWIVDLKGNFLEVNESYCKMIGYSKEEILKMSISDIEAKEGHIEVNNRIKQIKQNGFDRFDTKHKCKNGKILDVEINVTLLSTKLDSKLSVFIRDISKYKIAKQKLRESESNLKSIFSAMSEVIIELDNSGKFINIAPTSPELLYKPKDELVGKSLHETFEKKQADIFYNSIQESLDENKLVKIEYSLEINHHLKWFEGRISPKSNNTVLFIARDISLEKESLLILEKRDHEIKTINERLKLATDSAQIGVWDLDLVSNTLLWDKWMYKLYGIEENYFAGAYEAWKQGVHPEDIKKADQEVQEAISGNGIFDTQFRIVTPNGEIRHLKAFAKVIKDKNGKAIRMTGVNYDITNITHAKKALKESEDKFQSIYNNSPSGIFRSTPDGKVVSANPAFLEIYGFKNITDLQNIPAQDYYTSLKDREIMLKRIKTDGIVKSYITKEWKKDKTKIWVKCDYSGVFNKKGELIYIDGIVEDITEKIRNDKKIEIHNKRLRALTQILQNKFDNQKQLLDFTLEKALQLTESKIGYIYFYNEKTKEFILDAYSGDTLNKCKIKKPKTIYNLDETGCWGEAVRQQKAYIINDYSKPNKHKKGTPKGHVELKNFLTVPVFDKKEIKAVIGVANKKNDYTTEDIKQLTLLMDAVWKVVERERQNNELLKAKEKAEQSDRLKTEFLNNMSHEIRTPLNGILGFSKLICKDNISTDKRNSYAEIIQQGGKRLTRVIEDIVDISMIESNQLEIIKSRFNLKDSLSNIQLKHKHSNLLKSKPDIELKFNYSIPENIVINSDKIRVEQVMDNLITNALKYSDQGIIEIGCKLNNSTLLFYVKDEGEGIPKDQTNKLFQRFSHIKTDKVPDGTGIGLAISKGIIDLLGGEIWHEHNEPHGAIFSFTIPIDTVKTETPAKNSSTENQIKNNKNLIYVAEDDETSIQFMQEIFSETDYTVKYCKNGKILLDLIETKFPDLVLLDIKMPIMDGFTAFSIIKEKYPDLVVIAQTAHAMDNEKTKIKNAGFDDYISKPIDPDELFEKIDKWIK